MTDWYVHLAEHKRRSEKIERAAARYYTHEISRTAALAQERPARRHERFLAALGDRLVDWGCRLQARYRRLAENGHALGSEAFLAPERGDPAPCA